jgi:putative aminopeptidase FrvX
MPVLGSNDFRKRSRPFVHKKHKNDIIILFSDAEELGLNGAALLQPNWAKEVGLVLNFEARGTSGPSYMLMETNGNGNC